MSARPGQPVEILLVEDSPGDVELTVEALKEANARNRVRVVTNGDAALAFLRRTGEHQSAPRPDVIFLDLNLPRKGGMEVLEELKADPSLAAIPVIVLTTSRNEADVAKAYQLHANCYVTKPVRLLEFFDIVKAIEFFWLETVTLPKDTA